MVTILFLHFIMILIALLDLHTTTHFHSASIVFVCRCFDHSIYWWKKIPNISFCGILCDVAHAHQWRRRRHGQLGYARAATSRVTTVS